MEVLLLLIPVSLGMAALFVWLCLYAIRTGQFDDLEGPAWRVLFDSTRVAHSPFLGRQEGSAKPTPALEHPQKMEESTAADSMTRKPSC